MKSLFVILWLLSLIFAVPFLVAFLIDLGPAWIAVPMYVDMAFIEVILVFALSAVVVATDHTAV